MIIQLKDPSKTHFYISLLKSFLRIIGCLAVLWIGSLSALGWAFLMAELLGIIEEL